MTANASAHQLQILVGSDNQDWSAALVELDLGDSERDSSGLILTQGKLKLGTIPGAPDSMNPRTSAGKARWFKGQQITINVTDSSGSYTRHPRGWAYIAKPPLPPTKANPYLELDLVCSLQLQNYPQPRGILERFIPEVPDPDEGGDPTNSAARGNLVEKCLTQAGNTRPWTGTIPKHPVQISVYKDDPGSYIQLAGQIAYGGVTALHQDNQGNITAASAAVAPSTPLTTVQIGRDEILYEPTEGGETPCEQVKFTANYSIQVKTKTDTLTTSSRTDYGSGIAVDPSLTGDIPIRETTRSEATTPTSRTITELVREPLGMISPTAFPREASLGLSSDSVTVYSYTLPGGKLSSIIKTETQLFAKLCSSVFDNQSKSWQSANRNATVERKEETYYIYGENEYQDTVQTVTTIITEPLGAIVTDEKVVAGETSTGFDPFAPKVSLQRKTSWFPMRKGEWLYSQYSLASAVKIRSDIGTAAFTVIDTKGNSKKLPSSVADRVAVKSALVTDPGNTFNEVSNSGQNQPPAAERQVTQSETKDRLVEGAATFKISNTGFDPRKRNYRLETAVAGPMQLTELSQVEGALLVGRAQGARIQLPLLDAFLENPAPLQTIAVLEREVTAAGTRWNRVVYQLDGMEFTHDRSRAIVTASLIWLGTIEGTFVPHDATPVQPAYDAASIVPPYDSLTLSNSDATSSDLVITIPPLVNFPLARGLGLGRSIVITTPSPATVSTARGLGLGRGAVSVSLVAVVEITAAPGIARAIGGVPTVSADYLITSAPGIARAICGAPTTTVVVPREPETDALLAVFAGSYSDSRIAALDQCIKDLKAAKDLSDVSAWDYYDTFWIPAAPVEADALINWKNPGTYNLIKSGTGITFTSDRGFTGPGPASGWLRTQFNPSTASSPKFTQNSASFAYYVNGGASNGQVSMGAFGNNGPSSFLRVDNTVTVTGRLNNGGGESSFSVSSSERGLFEFDRSSSSQFLAAHNGSTVSTSSATSTGVPDVEFFVCNLNFGGTAGFGNNSHRIAHARIGRGGMTTSQRSAVYTAIQTYLSSFGANA